MYDIFLTHPSLKHRQIFVSHHFTGKTLDGKTVTLSPTLSESFLFLPDTIKEETVDKIIYDNLVQQNNELKQRISKLEKNKEAINMETNTEEKQTYEYVPLNDKEKEMITANISKIKIKSDDAHIKIIKSTIAIDSIEHEIKSKITSHKMSLAELDYDLKHHVSINKLKNDICEEKDELNRFNHNIKALEEQIEKGLKQPISKAKLGDDNDEKK